MRALALIADRKLELADVPSPPPPAADEVRIRVKAAGALGGLPEQHTQARLAKQSRAVRQAQAVSPR